MNALLRIRGLAKSYRLAGRRLQVLEDIDLEVQRGECLGVVGESGSGKTTLGLCSLRLVESDSGTVTFDDHELQSLSEIELRRLRRHIQMVFQNSIESLDPRLTIGEALAEPLLIHRLVPAEEIPSRIAELMLEVGLAAGLHTRYPHQLSGGQRQRLGIARALATGPRLLILDEPVSSLDVSVRAQILALLSRLKRRHDLTMVFISHDLATVAQMADRLAVMFEGRIVELGSRQQICQQPSHPYSADLFAAVPVAEPRRRSRRVGVAKPKEGNSSPASGCPFYTRCAVAAALGDAADDCRRQRPLLRRVERDEDATMEMAQVACHHPLSSANLQG